MKMTFLHHPQQKQLWPDFDQTLKVGSWNPLKRMQTVMVTFVHETFVQATFVHIRNISAVTDPILTKLFGPDFLQALNFFGPKILLTQSFFGLKKFLT